MQRVEKGLGDELWRAAKIVGAALLLGLVIAVFMTLSCVVQVQVVPAAAADSLLTFTHPSTNVDGTVMTSLRGTEVWIARQSPTWRDSSAIAERLWDPRGRQYATWWKRVAAQAEPQRLSLVDVLASKAGQRDTIRQAARPWPSTPIFLDVRDRNAAGTASASNVVYRP